MVEVKTKHCKVNHKVKAVEIIKDGLSFHFRGNKAKRLITLINEDEQEILSLFIHFLHK